jgi:hypothetical protein
MRGERTAETAGGGLRRFVACAVTARFVGIWTRSRGPSCQRRIPCIQATGPFTSLPCKFNKPRRCHFLLQTSSHKTVWFEIERWNLVFNIFLLKNMYTHMENTPLSPIQMMEEKYQTLVKNKTTADISPRFHFRTWDKSKEKLCYHPHNLLSIFSHHEKYHYVNLFSLTLVFHSFSQKARSITVEIKLMNKAYFVVSFKIVALDARCIYTLKVLVLLLLHSCWCCFCSP